MSRLPQIILSQLSFSLANGKTLFSNINLNLGMEKVALVGKNGVGKSTLLKLLIGEQNPTSGTLQIIGTYAYLPQNPKIEENTTLEEFLGVAAKLRALTNIENGSYKDEDFTTLNDEWDIKERVQKQLATFNLEQISLDAKVSTLSGGQKTRLFLSKVFASNADFLFLDEPTNNLDLASRKLLFKAIQNWPNAILVVTHDRSLLNLMSKIIELTPQGISVYSGNYADFLEQKNLHLTAQKNQLADAKKELHKSKISIQKEREKLEQRKVNGKKLRAKHDQPKSLLDAQKMRSENSQSNLKTHATKMLQQATENLQQTRKQIVISEKINIQLPKTAVPNSKIVLEIENLTFSYDQQPLINNFSLKIVGPQRIALMGNNGCGKSTLLKLITGELKPQKGSIHLGVTNIAYLDQNASLLNPNLSILENFLTLNPDQNNNKAHSALAQFLFRNVDANKKVANLSGGEKLRAALVCTLMSNNPPQLILLDEPTNHLDLESISNLEQALNCFSGALLVVTHDETFLFNIGIKSEDEIVLTNPCLLTLK